NGGRAARPAGYRSCAESAVSELCGETKRTVNVSHGPRETLFTLTVPPPPPSATTYHCVSFARSVTDSPCRITPPPDRSMVKVSHGPTLWAVARNDDPPPPRAW